MDCKTSVRDYIELIRKDCPVYPVLNLLRVLDDARSKTGSFSCSFDTVGQGPSDWEINHDNEERNKLKLINNHLSKLNGFDLDDLLFASLGELESVNSWSGLNNIVYANELKIRGLYDHVSPLSELFKSEKKYDNDFYGINFKLEFLKKMTCLYKSIDYKSQDDGSGFIAKACYFVSSLFNDDKPSDDDIHSNEYWGASYYSWKKKSFNDFKKTVRGILVKAVKGLESDYKRLCKVEKSLGLAKSVDEQLIELEKEI